MSATPPYLYIRKYRLTITTHGGQVIEVPDLRFTFRIEKRIPSIYQFGEVTIYNLSPDTETEIFKNGKSVTLEAGYENGPYGLIFQGPIRQPIRGKEDGVTYFLKLICIDGDDLMLAFSSVSLNRDQSFQQIANTIVRSANIPIEFTIDPTISQQKTARGKVIFGQTVDKLRSLGQSNNANIYVDNGKGYVSSVIKRPPAVVPKLNAETGMIGIPHQVDQGVAVRSLINPNFILDSWLKLNNQDIVQQEFGFMESPVFLDLDGLYRIIEIVMTGDTRGNDWYYDMVAVNQSGGVPSMLTSPSQNGI